LLQDLAKSNLATEATGMGQRLRMLAERMPNSPVSKIKETIENRIKYYEQKSGKKFTESVKNETSNIKSEISRTKPKADAWLDFVNSITC
jgi:hypothetical protein